MAPSSSSSNSPLCVNWNVKIDAQFGIHIPPVVANGVVYVGTGDSKIFALSAADGKELWMYQISNFQKSYFDPTWNRDGWNGFYAPLEVADGRVFVGEGNYRVYALGAADGAELWSFNTSGGLNSRADKAAPQVADGVVYFGSRSKNVYARNAADGAAIWSFPTAGEVRLEHDRCTGRRPLGRPQDLENP